MKKLTLILCILIILVFIVSFAQEKYEPLSIKEKELINQGYIVVEFNDTPYDTRPIYFKDGTISTKQTYKRVVVFQKQDTSNISLGKGYGGWSLIKNSTDKSTLILFYVIITKKVKIEKEETKEVKIPISLEEKKKEIPTSIGVETK